MKAVTLTFWKSQLDWAENELHNSGRVGEANFTVESHPHLLDPVTRGWKNGIKMGICEMLKARYWDSAVLYSVNIIAIGQ
jgi:hypothetical protein